MSLLFSNWLSENGLVQSLCWTLLHSLWQGLVITILAILIISITRRVRPSVRYNLFALLFLLFLAATVVTFVRELQVNRIDRRLVINSSFSIGRTIGASGFNTNTTQQLSPGGGYYDNIVQFLDASAPWIVFIWLIIFAAKLVKTIATIGYIQKIRSFRNIEPSDFWKRKVSELATRLDLKRAVLLFESSMVKAPVVVGFLKPMVLVPIGLLSNIPPQQVEAILLHELAHVRRHDYLMNLLQNVVEVIFFFNPGLLWISSLLKDERENCCDDITISQTNNKRQLIHALLAFQDYAMKQQGIAFAGERHHLLNRVRRIIYNENKKLNAMEKGIFVLSIVVISFIGFASMTQSGRQKETRPPTSKTIARTVEVSPFVSANIQPDTVPVPTEFRSFNSLQNDDGGINSRTIIAVDKDGRAYELVYKNQKPVELRIDGKLIPADEFDKYKRTIESLEQAAESRAEDGAKMLKADREKQLQLSELDAQRQNLLFQLKDLDRKRAELDFEKDKAKDFDENLDDEKKQKELMDLKSNIGSEHLHELLKDKSAADLLQNNILQDQALKSNLDNLSLLSLEKSNDASNKMFNQILADRSDLLKQYELSDGKNQLQALAVPIIDDMAARNIISGSEGDLTFELTKKSFTVNGKKQPSEVHEQFMKKYLKSDKDFYIYSNKGGRLSISINVN